MLEESVVYQDILQKGVQRGVGQGEQRMILKQLEQLLGKPSAKMRKQIEELNIQQLEELGEALLKFETEKDLTAWLKAQAITH
jgi:predicted transposase YdaD